MSTMNSRDAFRNQWGNNGRKLISLAIVAMLTAVSISVWATVATVDKLQHEPKLYNVSPQKVLTPIVPIGGILKSTGIKCNELSGPVYVQGTVSMYRVTDVYSIPRQVLVPSSSGGWRVPGCTTRHYENQLPVEAGVGRWQMLGIEVVILPSGEALTIGWFSEEFDVVAPDG